MLKYKNLLWINTLLFIFFFILNFFQPLFADDLYRGNIAALYHQTIFANLLNDYLTWTGRLSAQILIYPFLNQPYEFIYNQAFNFLNAFALLMLYHLIYRIITKHNLQAYQIGSYLFYILWMTIFLYYTGFLRNAIWKTGGVQYLWGIVLVLWFVQREYFKVDKKQNLTFSLFLGLFIGLYNEIFFVLIFMSFIFLFCCHYILTPVHPFIFHKNILFFIFGHLIGGIILIVAPGNYARKAFMDAGLEPTILENFFSFLNQLTLKISPFILLIMTFLFVLVYGMNRYIQEKKSTFLETLAVFGFVLMTYLVFIPVGHYDLEDRMLMFSHILFFVLLAQQVLPWFKTNILNTKSMKAFSILGITLVFGIHIYAYHHLYQFHQERIKLIEKYQIEQPEISFYPKYKAPDGLDKMVLFWDIEENATAWKNQVFAKYYRLKRVQVLE